MTINKEQNGSQLTVAIEGRLDTTTAPELEQELKDSLSGVTELTIDLGKLDYISSAGLRVLLWAQKTMNQQGSMKVTNVQEVVSEGKEVAEEMKSARYLRLQASQISLRSSNLNSNHLNLNHLNLNHRQTIFRNNNQKCNRRVRASVVFLYASQETVHECTNGQTNLCHRT